jgi:PAS domain S-box-containing protein
MKPMLSRKLSDTAEVRRVEILYERTPTAAVATLVGIFLCFVVLFGTIGLDIQKAWTAYMLSVFALRVWIWYIFGKADRQAENIRRWEWLFAAGAFLTSVGWGALFGPLYPPEHHHDAQVFILLLVVVVAFIGSFFLAVSNLAFWLFSIPALAPAGLHYILGVANPVQWLILSAACCMAVLILIQRALHRSAIDDLERSTEAESLLAEQQAIFESSPMGIAVIDNKQVIKCNARLGDMLGRRIQEITTASLQAHFVNAEEASQFLADRASAFDRGRLAQGMYRLRRADGTQFWAEFSGRQMAGGASRSVWMIADVTLRVANERRAHPRDQTSATR